MEDKNQSEVDSQLSLETPFSQDSGISESTPLIPGEIDTVLGGGDVERGVKAAAVSEADDDSWRFENELDKPWPATFERSISLLAGPTMDPSFIEQVTKSPKITPNLSKRKENVNYLTPETKVYKGGLIKPGHEFKQQMNKVQSLDFGTFDPNRRVADAKLYRQKLLEEEQKKKQLKMGGKKVDMEHGGKKKKQKLKPKPKLDGHGVKIDEKASFGQCTFNLANILMGVGMLGLPYIFKSAGWIGGAMVTLTFASVGWRTSILLGRELNGDPRPSYLFDDSKSESSSQNQRLRKRITSFPGIARAAFGHWGNLFLSLCLYFELFSCLCIFFVTLGDHLYTLFPTISVKQHMVHVAFVLAIPTALLRTPRLLSYLSAVGTVATACIVLSVLGSAITSGDISEEIAKEKDLSLTSTHTLWRTRGLPLAFGLIAFTFSGHAIIPSIHASMAQPQKFESMVTFTFVSVTICCLIVAVSGYYMFGSTVDDQITLSLEAHSGDHNILMATITWLMILTAFSKFTLTAFPLALGIEEIIAPVVPSDYVMEWVSSLIKLILIGSALAVAIFVPSFSFLCSLVGLICTMVVSVIFPAAAHLKLFGSHLPLWERVIDWIFIICGTYMTVVGTIQTV